MFAKATTHASSFHLHQVFTLIKLNWGHLSQHPVSTVPLWRWKWIQKHTDRPKLKAKRYSVSSVVFSVLSHRRELQRRWNSRKVMTLMEQTSWRKIFQLPVGFLYIIYLILWESGSTKRISSSYFQDCSFRLFLVTATRGARSVKNTWFCIPSRTLSFM